MLKYLLIQEFLSESKKVSLRVKSTNYLILQKVFFNNLYKSYKVAFLLLWPSFFAVFCIVPYAHRSRFPSRDCS